MVEKPSVLAFQNYYQINNSVRILRKLWAVNVLLVFCIDSVYIDSIECITRSLSCINSVNIYSIDGMVEKPLVSAFQNFLWIENRLNIKKVMGRNVWMCFDSSIDCLDKLSIQYIVFYSIFVSTVLTIKISCSIHNSIALIFNIKHQLTCP